MAKASTTTAEGGVKTAKLHGHTIKVWLEGSSEWHLQVVRDADQRVVVTDRAATEEEAWEEATAYVDRGQAIYWDHPIPVMPKGDYPGCPDRIMEKMERISRAAQGIEAIADVIFRHNLESDGFDPSEARALRPATVEGLARALGCLADVTRDAAHECAKEAGHD
jgi:hypothetical protein